MKPKLMVLLCLSDEIEKLEELASSIINLGNLLQI
jgi:hypothetical protein